MADNHMVTIDAAWFAELYARWQRKPLFSERAVADGVKAIRENEELRKERDELKAKLDDARHIQSIANENSTVFQNRLAAAERCIEDIERNLVTIHAIDRRVFEHYIREYREQKEAR